MRTRTWPNCGAITPATGCAAASLTRIRSGSSADGLPMPWRPNCSSPMPWCSRPPMGAVRVPAPYCSRPTTTGDLFFSPITRAAKRGIWRSVPRSACYFPGIRSSGKWGLLGRAERISAAESLAYFASRPHGSRLGAWVSQQSSVVSSRQLLEMKWEEVKRKFSDGEIPLPSFWGGFRVVPVEFEFWQGRENRLHDRFRYTQSADGWVVERLAP